MQKSATITEQRRQRKRTRSDAEPEFAWVCGKLGQPNGAIQVRWRGALMQWWMTWSLALVVHMTGEKPGDRVSLDADEFMGVRWEGMLWGQRITRQCQHHWFEWTLDRACDVTDVEWARRRYHALWALHLCGLPPDVCRWLVSRYLYVDINVAYKRGARWMQHLFGWTAPILLPATTN